MRNLHAEMRVIDSALGRHLFVVDGSRLYDLPAGAEFDDADLAELHAQIVPEGARRIDDRPLTPPPLQTLSLNLAQACNMACTYCYADEGKFGGKARLMPMDVARASVDRLLQESAAGSDVVVGFMGGEPFLHRSLMLEIAPYASRAAAACGRSVRFSLTTNATLLTEDDVRFLADYDFHVTVSLDGDRALNDRQRPLNGGGSAYDKVLAAMEKFERIARPRHLSARATVTPHGGRLRPTLDHLIGLGFDSVGFSPILVSPDPRQAFLAGDFARFEADMIECGQACLNAILAGVRYPFSNFEAALHEIHRGTHRPYPCGAGAGYLSVNAEGDLYACHRLIDDARFAMGDVKSGSDLGRRTIHLARRHVDQQEPCKSCWARYLCGGGCYHEVDRRGRLACDYIRGWLAFCIAAYAEISSTAPQYFTDADRHFSGAAGRLSVPSGAAVNREHLS